MLYFVLMAAGLFFFGDVIAMQFELMPVQPMDMQEAVSDCLKRLSRGSRGKQKLHDVDIMLSEPYVTIEHQEKVTTHTMQDINKVIINGNTDIERGKIQLKITQITDNSPERLIIRADQNVHSCVGVDKQGTDVKVELRSLDRTNQSPKDIVLFLALKKCEKIVTHGHVDTIFLSPIKADTLHIKVTSGATMKVPSMDVKTIELLVTGKSSLIGQDKAVVKAEDLIFVYREGLAKIMLEIETKLLQAQDRGKGEMRFAGSAIEQELLIRDGSFYGLDLVSNKIKIAQGPGEGHIAISAKELISGWLSSKSKHNAIYHINHDDLNYGSMSDAEIYKFNHARDQMLIKIKSIEDAEWNERFEEKIEYC